MKSLNQLPKKDLVKSLLKKPKRESRNDIPLHKNIQENLHYVDLVYMPDDDGYKYLLVDTTNDTKQTDAEPLKNRDSKSIIGAFNKIYSRNRITPPTTFIKADSGSEFNKDVIKYFKNKHIVFQKSLPQRHRTTGPVEKRINMITKVLFMIMTANELETGEQNNKWVDNVSEVIDELNKKNEKYKNQQGIGRSTKPTFPILTKFNQELYPIGTIVRVKLDRPVNTITGKREHGKFRETDIRWDKTPRKIEKIHIQQGEPPLYAVEGIRTYYTKQQLQPIH